MLSAIHNAPVLQLKDDAAAGVQVLSVSLSAVMMDTDHPAVVTPEDGLKRRFEGSVRISHVATKLCEGRVASDMIPGNG